MNDFTASNGVHVRETASGTVALHDGDASSFAETLDRVDVVALREFFQAEADERLGRWRDPAQPEFLVYPVPGDGSRVHVVDETTGASYGATRASSRGGHGSAAHYFDAHPEPKPWQDASRGELWAIAKADGEPAIYVVDDAAQSFIHVERRLLVLGLNDREIVSARRIWPEVSS